MSGPVRPPGAAKTVLETAAFTLLRTARGKRWMIAAALVLLPTVIALIVRASDVSPFRQERVFFGLLINLHFKLAVAGTALAFATAFPWPEADDASLTWWFTSPVKRWAVALGRFAAALVTGLVLLPCAALLLKSAVVGRPTSDLGAVARSAALATVVVYPAYLAVFSLVSAWTRRALVIGLVFVVLENFLVALQGNVARLTMIHHVKSLLAPSITPDIGRAAWSIVSRDFEASAASTSVTALVATTVIALALSLVLVTRGEYRGKTSQAA
ncbi:MAG: hypothetical protein HMLKMBBP_03600 [Planctomycetes bacterium]|nr:hypothetical protein [Planctomycetota bacterium]